MGIHTSLDRVDHLLEDVLNLYDNGLDLVHQGEDNLELGFCEGTRVLLGMLKDGDDVGEDVLEVELEADDGREENLGVDVVDVDELVACG